MLKITCCVSQDAQVSRGALPGGGLKGYAFCPVSDHKYFLVTYGTLRSLHAHFVMHGNMKPHTADVVYVAGAKSRVMCARNRESSCLDGVQYACGHDIDTGI